MSLGSLATGFSRTLTRLNLIDLWELDEARRSDILCPRLERNFYERCPPEKRPGFLRPQEAPTSTDEVAHEKVDTEVTNDGVPADLEKNAKGRQVYDESLVFALEKTFRYHFWLGGLLQLIGGMYLPVSIGRELTSCW